jgi:proline dehydrogenase
VRGAYHPHELAAHNKSGPSGHRPSISPDEQPPVWLTKEETDGCYDGCARMLIDHVQEDIGQVERSQGGRASPRIGVMFGTHNRNSCRMVLDRIVNAGLGTRVQGHEEGVIELGDGVTERVAIAHLYGQSASVYPCTSRLIDGYTLHRYERWSYRLSSQ